MSKRYNFISPGATIGILGSGQLGRMISIAAKQMGYRVHIYSPSHDSPAGQVSDLEIQAQFEDLDSINRFAQQVDVVTLEFENVPVAAVEAASKHAPVCPGAQVLEVTQHRIREKTFLQSNGFPVPRFEAIHSFAELQAASQHMPNGVLKTTTLGYDGKGQAMIREAEDLRPAWDKLATEEAIFEEWIDFEFEFSVIVARSSTGSVSVFPAIRNLHRNHILDVSVSPSGLDPSVERQAKEIANELANELDSVGVLCIEFFLKRDGSVVINELAPRPHNSGHLTIDAHLTSQFEQHVRAICGLPLGSTHQLQPAAMANLLGNCWIDSSPKWNFGMTLPNVKLHLYGKGIPEPGRKMGHMTALANTPDQAIEHVNAAKKLLNFQSRLQPNSPNRSSLAVGST